MTPEEHAELGLLGALEQLGWPHRVGRHNAEHRTNPFSGGECIPRDEPHRGQDQCMCAAQGDRCCQPMNAEDLLCADCREKCS